MEIKIHGSLWINSVKYEYVDKIIIDKDDVNVVKDEQIIGSVARENIETMIEQNYELNIMTDLLENMMHIIDIANPEDDGSAEEHWH